MRRVFLTLKDQVGDKARLVHHIHDEIIVECLDEPGLPEFVASLLEKEMREAMETLLKKVPVEVEPSIGKTWADVK